MSVTYTPEQEERWSRPALDRTGPIRGAGGLFRTAERGSSGLGGVPLNATEDAVVAAVRMAYGVAEAQVERSSRLAERLRDAGDRAVGSRSDRKAVDATEQLVFRTFMGMLGLLEGSATESDSPMKRVMNAQYRLVGSLLGMTPFEDKPSDDKSELNPVGKAERSAPRASLKPEGLDGSRSSAKVILKGGDRRPVRSFQLEIARQLAAPAELLFYSVEHIEWNPLRAWLEVDIQGNATLTLETQRSAPYGLWRAAICDEMCVQIGLCEIEL
jgi:hypothetical protein